MIEAVITKSLQAFWREAQGLSMQECIDCLDELKEAADEEMARLEECVERGEEELDAELWMGATR